MLQQIEIGEYQIEVDGSKIVVRDAAGWVVDSLDINEAGGALRLPNGELVNLAEILADDRIAQLQTAAGAPGQDPGVLGTGVYISLASGQDDFQLDGAGVLGGTDLTYILVDDAREPITFESSAGGKGNGIIHRPDRVQQDTDGDGIAVADRPRLVDSGDVGFPNPDPSTEFPPIVSDVVDSDPPPSSQLPSDDNGNGNDIGGDDPSNPGNSDGVLAGGNDGANGGGGDPAGDPPVVDDNNNGNGNDAGGIDPSNPGNGDGAQAGGNDGASGGSGSAGDPPVPEDNGGGDPAGDPPPIEEGGGDPISDPVGDPPAPDDLGGGDPVDDPAGNPPAPGDSGGEDPAGDPPAPEDNNNGNGNDAGGIDPSNPGNSDGAQAGGNNGGGSSGSDGNAPPHDDNGHGNDAGGYDPSNTGSSDDIAGEGGGAHPDITDLVAFDSDQIFALNGKAKTFGGADATLHTGEGIDIIDATNGAAHSITLSIGDILNITDDDNHLTILGGKGDTVTLTGDGIGTWDVVDVTLDATIYSWSDPANQAVVEISNQVQANIV